MDITQQDDTPFTSTLSLQQTLPSAASAAVNLGSVLRCFLPLTTSVERPLLV